MTDKEIFQELISVAKVVNSKQGAVAACLVRNKNILVSNASSDEPNRHAEDLLLEKIQKENIDIAEDDILYVTIQPCGERTKGGGGEKYGDCATKIINSPIKNVIYAVPDQFYSQKVDQRFKDAGIDSQQIDDYEIAEVAKNLFNTTITNKEYIKKKGNRAFL